MTTPEQPSARASASWGAQAGSRAQLAKVIPRRHRVTWRIGLVLAISFAAIVLPLFTAERWLAASGTAEIVAGRPAPITVRVPVLAGYQTDRSRIGGDAGILVDRGEIVNAVDAGHVTEIAEAMPGGPLLYLAYLLFAGVLAGIASHHTRRSNRGRLLRVQLVNFTIIVIAAILVKFALLATSVSVLVVPVALFAILPTLVLDRSVGLATGALAALTFAMLLPFDLGIAILLLVQAGTAGLVVPEQPKARWRAALAAGATSTLFTAATYVLLEYLTHGHLPTGSDPLHATWLAAAIGPAIATVLAVPLIPFYQRLVGEITQRKLARLEDLSHPLLRQIAEKAPGSWQHSLMMANMAELAATSIGANGRLARVGAYFHDLGKSLQPKYFIENLEPGETSPHDRLPPDASCDAIFAHVTEGIVTARRAGLHERIVDFMHMHHGNGVLEYFWSKCREQGNPKYLTVEAFRYPGVPPQSRETAILAICDAVEAASRTLKKPDAAAIESLVQRIVYGKLHLGQLDESGLSMSDLRRVADSLHETIRHANHGRVEHPSDKTGSELERASAELYATTAPRLDSLDRPTKPDEIRAPQAVRDDAHAVTGGIATPRLRVGAQSATTDLGIEATAPVPREAPPEVHTPAPRGSQPAVATRDSRPPASAARGGQSSTGSPIYVRPTDSGAVISPAPIRTEDNTSGIHRVVRPVVTERGRDDKASETIERRRSPTSAEVKQFATDAAAALNDASKDIGALPRDVVEVPAAARNRAATLPPTPPRRAPTVPPTYGGGRTPTHPPWKPQAESEPASPLFASSNPSAPPELAPSHVKHPGPRAADERTTIPPPLRHEALLIDDPPVPLPRRTAERVAQPAPSASDDSSTTQPRMFRVDDAASTRPRLERADRAHDVGDITRPKIDLRGPARPHDEPASADSPWGKSLASRIDAALDDDFGTETPVSPPTRAEMQALLGSAPDPTRQQSFEEIERLHRASQEQQRPSDPILEGRRHPHPTSEVDPDDIESVVELAPPARRSTIGVAKKKPSE